MSANKKKGEFYYGKSGNSYRQGTGGSRTVFAGGTGGKYDLCFRTARTDPSTGKYAGEDAVSQARQSLTNISNILAAAGASMKDAVSVTVLLDDISAFQEVNKVYAEFFEEPYPARACFEVAKLPAGGLVEIQVTAVKQ